ncbi:porin [Vibrio tapetis subsp. quintayensis]|uniref:porin n=1 Tax=Vibrio tapetis TaxID=52443 RepID=UPI0025B4290E|nr:porin [Vibrio tapetis]MDN3682205.1 porin [Vibrio tapetis subsp. quintayensis]
MNKTLISVLVANALVVSTSAYAANNQRGITVERSIYESVVNDAMNFGGHIGTSFEYEDKVTTDFNGSTIEERTKTHEVFGFYYSNPTWNLAALYALKLVDREQVNSGGYHETENSYKHLISMNKGFDLSDGWTTGLIYDLEITDSRVFSKNVTAHPKRKFEHSLRPYLTYWNNEYNAGVYTNLEYLYNDENKASWGNREEKGYSFLIKPYKRMGNWEFGVELFYQIKDNDDRGSNGTVNEVSDFTEKYAEPIVQYSFEDAGALYVRTRIGENKTTVSDGWSKGDEYFKDIRKATVGYEQAVGDDWLIKAEYEWANDKETHTSKQGQEKNVDQNTFFLQALYRL